MIPLWFLPYAIACGNTFILKPSERVPLTARRLFELLAADRHSARAWSTWSYGGKAAVDALLRSSGRARPSASSAPRPWRATSTREARAHGKRVQCQGGAKNHVVVMPDADLDMTRQDRQRQRVRLRRPALPGGLGRDHGRRSAAEHFATPSSSSASGLRVGNGLEEGVQMGPVITPASKTRIEGLIAKGVSSGAKALLDGRKAGITAAKRHFVKPTVLDGVARGQRTDRAPRSSDRCSACMHADGPRRGDRRSSARSPYGNAASIFTSSGDAARKFRYEVPAGNIGVNIGVAAPMAYFPFSGWKDSFMGVLHGQGRDGVEFYTDKKVVIERWPKEWSRKF